jgi:hypothetical protein
MQITINPIYLFFQVIKNENVEKDSSCHTILDTHYGARVGWIWLLSKARL